MAVPKVLERLKALGWRLLGLFSFLRLDVVKIVVVLSLLFALIVAILMLDAAYCTYADGKVDSCVAFTMTGLSTELNVVAAIPVAFVLGCGSVALFRLLTGSSKG
ncbi:MAG: hypothetical protein ABIH41_06090 [Nanoarchaeota archaeon]